jgi:hypothetical protein
MNRVDLVLSNYISQGKINWDTLEKKLTAFLDVVGHNPTAVDPQGNVIKIADATTFRIKDDGVNVAIKLNKVRFHMGHIYIESYQKGVYDENGKPMFPFPEIFV